MINHEHTAVVGGCKGKSMPDAQLPYIDHLSVDQLRQRAADDRADALAMVNRASAATVSMLLEDAERCESRATMLEQLCGGSITAGLGELTIGTALTPLVQAARRRVVGDQPGRPPPGFAAALTANGKASQFRGRDMVERLAQLTAREVDVLVRLVAGKSSRDTAPDLGISVKTVECYRAHIMEKLGCSGLFELGRAWEAAVWSNQETTVTR